MFARHTTPSASTFFAALLAVGLLWPGGEARAQVNCTLSSGVATCVDQPYSGILFEAGTGWTAGVAGNAAVTVNGGTNTRITAQTGRSDWRSGGIVVRTSPAASREITLTVGTGGNRVEIREHATASNHGIYVHQHARAQTPDPSNTTVTLSSEVFIGLETAPMRRTGVHVIVLGKESTSPVETNVGVHTIMSAATIYSTTFGIQMVNRGRGGDVVTNSGSITTATTGGGPGIEVSPGSGSEDDLRTGSSTTTNSGSITTTVANARGILVLATGVALYKVVNSGTISVSGVPAHGILVDGSRFKGGTPPADPNSLTAQETADGTVVGGIEIENSGTITASGAGSFGIQVEATGLMNTGTDPITIMNSGDVTSASHAILTNSEQGAVTVTASGGTLESTSGDGIAIQQRADAAMTVTSGADITAGMHGIRVQAVPDLTDATTATTGDISITTTGGTIKAESPGRDGIYAEDHAAHTGSVMVSNAASITAGRYGINADRKGAGAVSVTNTGGTVLGKTNSGIIAWNKADDTNDVTVSVTGGTVQSEGQSTPAISAGNRGTGSVTVTIAAEGDAEAPMLNSMYNAGVYANLEHADNTAGKIAITQGGTIEARKGVYARAGRASAEGETRMADDQPLIDVTWSGTFSHGTMANVSQDDMGRYVADTAARAVAVHQEVETEKAIRYGSPAGIEAQVMSWRAVMSAVAAGDAPAEADLDDNAEQMAAVPTGAMSTGDNPNPYVAAFKAALTNPDLAVAAAVFEPIKTGATSLTGVTDAEIVTYLQTDDAATRTLLRNLLAQGLSDAEKAVLQATVTNTGLDTALDDADAGFSDDYMTAVKALLMRHNVGNIRVNMTGGSIASRGDGIRAYYATPNDDNGAISVTVAEGASVTGSMAGIYVANAGAMGTGADRILNQTVTVNGMVTGGSDAAVHLVGGGTLTVGQMGKLMAGDSGAAIKVNEPGRSVITVNGAVEGSEGAAAAMDLSGGGTLTVGEMGKVVAGSSGVAVTVSGRSAITINGEVTGNPGEGRAVVELAGGGTLTVGEMGSVMAAEGASGRAVKASGEEQVQVAIYAPRLDSQDDVDKALARLSGGIEGPVTTQTDDGSGGTSSQVTVRVTDPAGRNVSVPFNPQDNGNWNPEDSQGYARLPECTPPQKPTTAGVCADPPPPTPMPMEEEPPPAPLAPPMLRTDCDLARDECRLYQALPSMLLSMSDVPTYAERMSAAQEGRAGWARVDVGGGKGKAASTPGRDVDTAYDYRRHGLHAGLDFAMGDAGRAGVSFQGLRGSAEMSQVGEVDLSGYGLGVHATTMFAGGFHVDAQAAVTRYEADLESLHPEITPLLGGKMLKKGVDGRGFALGVEVGKRMALDGGGGMAVTPYAGLTWAKAGLDNFMDEAGRSVSVEDATSLKGRVGAGVEKSQGDDMDGSRLFGSVAVEQEFKGETEVRVYGSDPLKSKAEKTGFRLALGGARVWAEGRYSFQGSVGYTASGGDNRDLGGGVSFAVRF